MSWVPCLHSLKLFAFSLSLSFSTLHNRFGRTTIRPDWTGRLEWCLYPRVMSVWPAEQPSNFLTDILAHSIAYWSACGSEYLTIWILPVLTRSDLENYGSIFLSFLVAESLFRLKAKFSTKKNTQKVEKFPQNQTKISPSHSRIPEKNLYFSKKVGNKKSTSVGQVYCVLRPCDGRKEWRRSGTYL